MPAQASIIVPTYNYGRYLPRALDSLLAQRWAELQIIVVDDGSTDNTWEVLKRYTPRVLAIRQVNAGVSVARNRGIAEARSPYIGFLDPDDLYHPEKVCRQVATLESRPECGWTHCDAIFLDEATGRSCRFSEQYRYNARLALEGPRLFEALIPSNFISPVSLMIRRSCLDQAGYFDERFAGIEDFDLVLRLAAAAPAAYSPEVLATYVSHPGSLSGDRARVDRDKYLILDKIASRYPDRIRRHGRAARRAVADMHNWFAYQHLAAGDWADAVARLRASLRLCPAQGRAAWSLLRALANAGRQRRAA